MSYEWGGDGNWTAYTADVNELLVAANSSGKQEIEVYMGSCDYVISLSQMRQRQKHNPTKTRRVRWNDNATPKPAAQGGSSTRGQPMPHKNHQPGTFSGRQGGDGCSSRLHSTQSSTHSPGQAHSSPSASQPEDAELLEWPVYTLSINGAPHAHVPDPRNPDIVIQYPIYRLPVDHASHPNVPVIVYEGIHYLVKDKGPLPAAATKTSAVPDLDLRGDSSLQPFHPQHHAHASQHTYGELGGSYIRDTSALSPSSYSNYSPSRHQSTKVEQFSPNRGPTYQEVIDSHRGEYLSPYPSHVGQSPYSGSLKPEYRDSSQIPFSRDKSPSSSSDSPTWSHVYEPRRYGDSLYPYSDVAQSHSHAEQGYQSFDPRFQIPPHTYPSAYPNYPQSHTAEKFERSAVGVANGRSYFATAATERHLYGAAENYDSHPIRGTGLDYCAPAPYYAPARQM